MTFPMRKSRPFYTLRRFALTIGVLLPFALTGCIDPVSMIASSVLSAALKTAMEQAEKNRPTSEQLWQQAQLEQLEFDAQAGNPAAQFKLGQYYIHMQDPTAQVWVCAAANQGHARAQLQYGHWYNEDRAREDLFPFIAIVPNNSDAYLWYALAAENGEPRAPHFRDSLIYSGIQTSKLDQARARLTNWSGQPCAGAVIKTAKAPADINIDIDANKAERIASR
jgi:TPR repeat protein